jgi:hypothetical protein
MIRRTATGNAKNGMTWAQLRRQLDTSKNLLARSSGS